MCVYVNVHPICADTFDIQKRALDFLELEL